MKCEYCGYDGYEGWRPVDIGQTWDGRYIQGLSCPHCGEIVCEAEECPPDEFGQTMSSD